MTSLPWPTTPPRADAIAERYEESRLSYPSRVTEFVTTTAALVPGAATVALSRTATYSASSRCSSSLKS